MCHDRVQIYMMMMPGSLLSILFVIDYLIVPGYHEKCFQLPPHHHQRRIPAQCMNSISLVRIPKCVYQHHIFSVGCFFYSGILPGQQSTWPALFISISTTLVMFNMCILHVHRLNLRSLSEKARCPIHHLEMYTIFFFFFFFWFCENKSTSWYNASD